jgi:Na+/H+ antiporter NhaD/arsenite permease-like protein
MAEASSPSIAVPIPTWAVIPFVGYLVLIAMLPLFAARLWESNRNKLVLAIVAGIPAVAGLAGQPAGGLSQLFRTGCDYLAFMALLGALFAISGGIRLRGALIGTPLVNTVFLAAGALLASLVGTTGASALLIRPLLRANAHRARPTHLVVFFIFIVANAGGLLTPLGDPPLFLGFLRGVPFAWTLRLAPAWALVNGVLLALFAVFDRVAIVRERRTPRRPRPSDPALEVGPLRVEGGINLLWLLGIVGVVFGTGMLGARLVRLPHLQMLAQVAGMALFAALSWITTPREVRDGNRFSWAPMVEVAAIFLGVFITMIPALSYLEQRGASLGVTQPWQFFWASGALSSVLDNAPTYLTFASLAVGVTNAGGGVLSSSSLGALAAHPTGQHLLAAVSCGSVMMGAVTYIGNGPNFMVKAIAEQHRVRTPSFFGYVVWSGAILLPLFALVSHLFF